MSWIILLSVVGILLICLEMFLPGMVIGTAGALCLIGAVVTTYALYGAHDGNVALSTLLIASAVALALWIVVFPKTRSGRSMITSRNLADSKSSESLDALLGKEGQASTPLRPAGAAQFEGRRVDVVAESGLIDQGSSVKAVRVEGNRVMVRKV